MKQIVCHLQSLHCHHCQEREGDELFMKFNGKKIWPSDEKYVKGNDNCIIPINFKMVVEALKPVTLELWDYDFLINDLLGRFIFMADEEGQFRSDLRSVPPGDHKFTLEFSVYSISHSKVS
jgi:hypothetical protein